MPNIPHDVKVNNNDSNFIFAADWNNINKCTNINQFSKTGDFLKMITQLERIEGLVFLFIDKYSNILISDITSKCIRILSREGHQIHQIHCNEPTAGVVVNSEFDIFCVSHANEINIL